MDLRGQYTFTLVFKLKFSDIPVQPNQLFAGYLLPFDFLVKQQQQGSEEAKIQHNDYSVT